MFLCARDASARPQGAPGAAHALAPSSDDAQRPAPRPARALAPHRPPLRPSLAEDAQASAAYLRVLAALTRLVAQLLDVHALSPSLRFVAGEAVAVDAAEWWRELQRRSVARLQRQEAAHERGKPTGGSRLWPLAARGQEQQQDHREDSGVWVSSRTFEDLPEDMWTDRASDLFVQALYLIIQAMDRVSTAQGQEIEQVDAASVVDALASVDAGAAFAAAQLLHMWAPVSQKTLVDSAQKLASLLGVAVVNVLLQPRGVGVKHDFHEHALLPSLPLRAFLGAKQWRCSVCERVTQTSGDSARAGGVYRCAACNFNLCRECFTRIPNVKEAARRSNPLADVTRLTTDRFFELVVPQLKHKTGAVAVRQIAQELQQAARTLSFLVASLANAHEEKEWVFSLPLVEDGKLLLAHLIVLVVRYSGHSALKSSGSSTSSSFCSPSSFWKIVQSSGDIMERRVGDLDTHVR
ncbi:ubiquitin conjugation factor e4 [Phytophthora cinnamomi]|uniref:ubiquitin conjugation factor e4 n=1 Tax=Phytophthora cinnamomi TaxID=4785 RepID=UPI00355A9876|nr:ubiquitin conjugation factor e4 [Phytophthora cinnamomi]